MDINSKDAQMLLDGLACMSSEGIVEPGEVAGLVRRLVDLHPEFAEDFAYMLRDA